MLFIKLATKSVSKAQIKFLQYIKFQRSQDVAGVEHLQQRHGDAALAQIHVDQMKETVTVTMIAQEI